MIENKPLLKSTIFIFMKRYEKLCIHWSICKELIYSMNYSMLRIHNQRTTVFTVYIYMLFPVLLQNHGKVSKTVKMIWSLTARLFFNVLISLVTVKPVLSGTVLSEHTY